jgi:CheY-like chemotaxis protein
MATHRHCLPSTRVSAQTGTRMATSIDQGSAPRGPRAATVESAGERVLVVDDYEDGAMLLADALQAMGYDVCIAHDGAVALELASAFHPTIGLLDIGMPDMDGYELARRLRAEPWAAGLRLVAISGYGAEADIDRARAAGFDEHIVKPVRLATVERVLAPARAAR